MPKPVSVTIPTDMVAAAVDQDLPGQCWRHGLPAVRIQRLTVDNYRHTFISSLNNWRSIRWPVCDECLIERRAALRRGITMAVISLCIGALAFVAWPGRSDRHAVGVVQSFAPLIVMASFFVAVLAIYGARWAVVVGVAPSDVRFSGLVFEVAPGVLESLVTAHGHQVTDPLAEAAANGEIRQLTPIERAALASHSEEGPTVGES